MPTYDPAVENFNLDDLPPITRKKMERAMSEQSAFFDGEPAEGSYDWTGRREEPVCTVSFYPEDFGGNPPKDPEEFEALLKSSLKTVNDAPPPSSTRESGLTGWWREQADRDIKATIPKAEEYGGVSRDPDLAALGRNMASLMGWEQELLDDSGLMQELSIYFYVQGKMARWSAAIRRGTSVSDDTIFDIGIYTKMVQRIRQSGGWPL